MNIIITRVKAENGWLSAMSPHPVTHEGKTYKTCEALFQALRFKDHPEIQEAISNCPSPMGAKMIARKNKALLNRGGKWDEAPEDLILMKQVLGLKIEQYPELRQRLTDTGTATIIEDCTSHDRESARFWGMVHKNDQWIGENLLGKIWMEIRENLLNNIKGPEYGKPNSRM